MLATANSIRVALSAGDILLFFIHNFTKRQLPFLGWINNQTIYT